MIYELVAKIDLRLYKFFIKTVEEIIKKYYIFRLIYDFI